MSDNDELEAQRRPSSPCGNLIDEYIAREHRRNPYDVLQALMDMACDRLEYVAAARIAEILLRSDGRGGQAGFAVDETGRPVRPLLDSEGRQAITFAWAGDAPLASKQLTLDASSAPAPAGPRTDAEIGREIEALKSETAARNALRAEAGARSDADE